MDVYAKRKSDGKEVRIGIGHNMYQIRYDDRHKVSPIQEREYHWRLPYPDEDDIEPGDYHQWMREYILKNYTLEKADENVGSYQLYHQSGLVLGVMCYHGVKLPEKISDYYPMWLNENTWHFALTAVKKTEEGMKCVVNCRWCRTWWFVDIIDLLSIIDDIGLRERLRDYIDNN